MRALGSVLFASVAFAAAVFACAEGTGVDTGEAFAPDASKRGPDGSSLPPSSDGGSVPTGDASDDGASEDAAADGCAAALAKITFDFESGPAGFTHKISDGVASPPDPSWPYDPWNHGTAAAGTACHAGSCFGAELAQNYAQCQRGELLSPTIDLSACQGKSVALVFHHAYGYWTGSYGGDTWFDGGIVEVSGDDGASWAIPQGTYPGTLKINPNQGSSYSCVKSTTFGVNGKQGFVGKQATTAKAELTLPPNAITDKVRIRFSVASGVSSETTDPNTSRTATDFGWRIDDIGFVAK
jgi:hypothetical protein